MRKLFLLALTGLFVSCSQAPSQLEPSKVFGLLEIQFHNIQGKISSSTEYIPFASRNSSLKTPGLASANLPVVTPNGSATTGDANGQRYITATYNISNPVSGTNFTNLTFHAVKVNSTTLGALSVGNTALRNIKDLDGNLMPTASIAEGILPGHKVNIGVGGTLIVDANGADFNHVPATDSNTVQAAADASTLGVGNVTPLDYAFTARQSATSPARAIAAGGTGIVTLGYNYPVGTNPTTPQSFSVTYLVTDESETRVTRSLEESNQNTADVCARATAASATKIFVLGAALSPQVCPNVTITNVTPDSTPPTVQQTTPTGSDVDTTTIQVRFSEAMNQTSVSLTSNPALISELSNWNADSTVAEWRVAFTASTSYTLTVTGQDLAGNGVTTPSNSWSVTTKAPASANTTNDSFFSGLGGTAAVADFFDSSDEGTIRAALESNGMHYTVLNPVGIAANRPFSTRAIDDCSSRFTVTEGNTWYHIKTVNGIPTNTGSYFIDNLGRPQKAVMKAPPIAAGIRSTSCQSAVGKLDFPSGYDGGHLLASQLGGWGKRLNLVPQNSNFNRGNWVQIENQFAKCSTLPIGSLRYEVSLYYPNDSTNTPSTFTLNISVNTASISETFENTDGGGLDGTIKRERVVTWLIAQGCGDPILFNLKLTSGDPTNFVDTYPDPQPADYTPPSISYSLFYTEDNVEVTSINPLYCQQQRVYTLNYRSTDSGKVFAKSNDFKVTGRPCKYELSGRASVTSYNHDANGAIIDLQLSAGLTVYPREFPGASSAKVYENGTDTGISWDLSALKQDQSTGASYSSGFASKGSSYGMHEITIKAFDTANKTYLADFNYSFTPARLSYKIYITRAGELCPATADSCSGD